MPPTIMSDIATWRRPTFPENDGGPLTCTHSSGCAKPATHLVVRAFWSETWAVTTHVDRIGSWEDLVNESKRFVPRYQRAEFCRAHAEYVCAQRNTPERLRRVA